MNAVMERTVEQEAQPAVRRTDIVQAMVMIGGSMRRQMLAAYEREISRRLRREITDRVAVMVEDGREYVVRYSQIRSQLVRPQGLPAFREEDLDEERRLEALVVLQGADAAEVGEWVHAAAFEWQGDYTVHTVVTDRRLDGFTLSERVFEVRRIHWPEGTEPIRVWERTR